MIKPTDTNKIHTHFNINDPKLYSFLIKINPTYWINEKQITESSSHYFRALCRDIIGQQLSGKAADAIHKKFLAMFDVELLPEHILRTPEEKLREAGLSWAKVRAVKDLADKVEHRVVILDKLNTQDDEEIVEQLIKVKGVGRWTAEMFLIFTLNRENVFSFGDLGLKKGIEKIYGIQNPTSDKMAEIIQPWNPYKTYGTITLWKSLELPSISPQPHSK